MRRAAYGCVVLVLGLMLAGCANKDKTNATHDQTAAKEHSLDPFEMSSGDPPLTANTRFAAGQLAEAQQEYDKAIGQFKEALKLDPKLLDAQFHLASVLTKLRRYPEAIPAWQHYLEMTNHAPAAYNDLAFCYELAGQIDKAEETYRAGIASSPQDTTCRVNYGLMLARQNRIDDAAAQLNTALKPAEVSYNLGSVFEQMGKTEQAKAYYHKALEQDPNLRDAKAALAKMK